MPVGTPNSSMKAGTQPVWLKETEGGEMGSRIRNFEWSTTSLGPLAHWPESLRMSVRLCLSSGFPMNVWWGPDLVNLYNDPFIPTTHKQREHDLKMKSVPLTPANLKKYDVVLLSTDHTQYDYEMIVKHAKVVVDSRNATKNVVKGREKIWKA